MFREIDVRHFTASLLVATMLIFLSPAAEGKPLDGRVGLGLEQSLSGLSGITLRYWPLDAFGLTATVGAKVLVPPSGDDTRDVGTQVVIAIGGIYNLATSLHANLGVGLRGGISITNEAFEAVVNGTIDESRLPQFILEVPIVAEFFLSDNFSVSVTTGVLLAFVPEGEAGSSNIGGPVPGINIGVGTGTVSGSLGVMYYF
jgi:hypothetical protein